MKIIIWQNDMYLKQCDVIEILHMLHKPTSISNWTEYIYFSLQYFLNELLLTFHLLKIVTANAH